MVRLRLNDERTRIIDEPAVFSSPRAWVDDQRNYVADDWRHSSSWPPAGTVQRKFYLTGDGRLSGDAPGGESRSYRYDPRRPIPTLGGRNMMIAVGSIDQRRVQALPNYGLTYRSEILDQDLTIAVQLRSASTFNRTARTPTLSQR
jgi:predicted acyl esterase